MKKPNGKKKLGQYILCATSLPRITQNVQDYIHKNPFAHRYLTDSDFRLRFSLNTSLVFNLFYAVLRLTFGIYYASFWYGADALYYVVLSLTRFLLLQHVRKEKADLRKDFRKYRLCGILLFLLNTALIGVVYQIIYQNMGYQYPGVLIYVVATYSFYCIVISIKNVIKYHKKNQPIRSAEKAISLSKSLVSIFALQTAMFASFSEDPIFERRMNEIFGIAVLFSIFCIAVFMVFRANKALKNLN